SSTLACISRMQDARLLISVLDLKLNELASRPPAFREIGATCVLSSPRVIDAAQDKWRAFEFMCQFGIPTPKTYRTLDETRRALAAGDVRYPLLIKPRWGVSSMGIEWIDNDRQLALAYEWGQVQLQRSMLAKLCHGGPADAFV